MYKYVELHYMYVELCACMIQAHYVLASSPGSELYNLVAWYSLHVHA